MPDAIGRASRRWQHVRMTARLLSPYVAFALLKHVIPLPRLARWAWLRPVRTPDDGSRAVALQCAVRVRQWFGAERGDCLHGSLALYRVLSRAGANPTLVVGFRRDTAKLAGHAWIEIEGESVIEAPPRLSGFERACAFGPRGALLPMADETKLPST